MGLFDTLFGSPEEDEKARKALEKAQSAYNDVNAPVIGEIGYDSYQDTWNPTYASAVGLDSPQAIAAEQANAAQVNGTAFDGISSDPRLKQAQMDALMSLQDLASNGGMTAADKALIARQRSDVAAQERGSREAILQNMSQRGMGGSSMELLAKLQASQSGTDRLAQEGLDVTGMAQQRALDALSQGGALAGNLRGQDFSEQSTVANARDAINQFNAGNTQQANLANMAARNNTNQFNSSQTFDAAKINNANANAVNQLNTNISNEKGQSSQSIANANVDQKNQNTVLNKVEIPQANFGNQMTLANGKSGAATAAVDYWGQKGNQTAATKAGLLDAAVKGGVAAYTKSDENSKKDIKEISSDDIEEFLRALQPKKFKYKNPNTPKTSPGQRVGFIAQDVADTKIGKDLIKKGEDGEMEFDPLNLQGVMLAALKKISEDKE